MQISVNLFADSREELKAQLIALADAVPDVFAAPGRGFSIHVMPENPGYGALGLNQAAQSLTNSMNPKLEQTAPPVEAADDSIPPRATPATPVPTTLSRGRPSRAKGVGGAASQAEAPPAPSGPDAEPDAEPDADMDPFAGDDQILTPEEAKLAALEVLREVYALPGGPKAVKAVQTEFNVTKFVEVPDGQGPRLHARALEVKAGLNP